MKPTDALPHPADWSVKTVREAVEIRRGLSWSKDQERDQERDDTVAVLRITNVQDRLDLSDILHISGVPDKSRELKKATKEWSILVGSNGNRKRIGNAVYLGKDLDFLFASFLIGAKPLGNSGILPSFFFRWLNTAEVQARLTASSEGTTGLSNLSHAFFRAMEIAFPCSTEQCAIVAILDCVDSAIEQTRTAIEKARQLKTGLTQALLSLGIDEHGEVRNPKSVLDAGISTRFGRFPREWQVLPLRSVAEVGSGVTLGKKLDGIKTVKVPYLRVANVQDGYLDLSEIKSVEVKIDDVAKLLLQAGDVLMTEGGDLDKLGRGAVWEDQISPCLHQNHVFRVRTNRKKLDPYYMEALIGAEYGKRYFMRIAKRTTNLASINKTQLRAFPMPLPPEPEQKRIVRVLHTADARIQPLEDAINALLRLKVGLMQDLLTGTVRVPIPKTVKSKAKAARAESEEAVA